MPAHTAGLPPQINLQQVPFFPQEEFQCGPAALATVLNWHQVPVASETLTPMVYVPAKRGSFQYELMAATRRFAHIPYVIAPGLEYLLRELAAGRPVLVLQNLGLSWWPVWHYAVVVGYDLHKQEILLRSGLNREHSIPLFTFDRTWRRAERWAMVVLGPDEMPATVDTHAYLQAVAALEQLGYWDEAIAAYSLALQQWPANTIAAMGLANTYFKKGDVLPAEGIYRRLIAEQPQFAAAYNNLAHLLMTRHRWQEAEYYARVAVKNAGPLAATYQKTLAEILSQSVGKNNENR